MAFILLDCAFAFRIRMPALGGYREHDDHRMPWRMRVMESLVPRSFSALDEGLRDLRT